MCGAACGGTSEGCSGTGAEGGRDRIGGATVTGDRFATARNASLEIDTVRVGVDIVPACPCRSCIDFEASRRRSDGELVFIGVSSSDISEDDDEIRGNGRIWNVFEAALLHGPSQGKGVRLGVRKNNRRNRGPLPRSPLVEWSPRDHARSTRDPRDDILVHDRTRVCAVAARAMRPLVFAIGQREGAMGLDRLTQLALAFRHLVLSLFDLVRHRLERVFASEDCLFALKDRSFARQEVLLPFRDELVSQT